MTEQELEALRADVATGGPYPAMRKHVRGLIERLDAERLHAATVHTGCHEERNELQAEIDAAMAVLNPSMPESGLVDACKQVKQVAISEADNAEKAFAEVSRLRRVIAEDGTFEEVIQLRKNLLLTWAAAEVREYDLRQHNELLKAELERVITNSQRELK